jgi:hypothetical protein
MGMIPQAFLYSLPFLSSAAVSSATNLFVSAKQREQNYRLALFNARLRREEMEASRKQRLTEIALAHANATNSQLRREEWEVLVRTYPFEAGPGELAKAIHETFPDSLRRPLPVVILERVTGDAGGVWQNLHTEARVALAELQREGVIFAATSDRAVRWPNSRLREYDLGARPTIVVTPEVGADRLHLMVGGGNLLPSGCTDVLPMTPMMTIEFRQEAELKRYSFARAFDDEVDEVTLVPVRRLDETNVNLHEIRREYVKLGASAIQMLVARLADHYHLANRYGYAPRFERLVKRFEARANRAGDSALCQESEIPAIPEQAVADLPYYRLIRATGNLCGETPHALVEAVAHSLAALGGREHPSDVPAVARLVAAHTPTATEEGAAFREAHRLLCRVPEATPGRSELLDAVNKVLGRLTVTKSPTRPTSAPAPLSDDPRYWVSVLNRALAASPYRDDAVDVLGWSQVVSWFRERSDLVLSDQGNVAVMVRQTGAERGTIRIVMGIYDRLGEKVIAVGSILAMGLDQETRRQFGANDVCIVT